VEYFLEHKDCEPTQCFTIDRKHAGGVIIIRVNGLEVHREKNPTVVE